MISKLKKILFYNRFFAFNVYKTEAFVRTVSGKIGKDSRLLDVGAGLCPYKKYFKHVEYVSQDFCVNGENDWDFSHIDIKSDADKIPVEDGSFDNILCTSVLEHLKYPDKAFHEFSRILKTGGKIYLVAPLTWAEHHEPFDYYRFTKFCFRQLAEDNNLKVMMLRKQGGFFIFISQTFSGLSYCYIKNKILANACFVILYPINYAIAFICYFLDKFDRTKVVVHYECIFEKKERQAK
jgi:SAM-dependent methyltransferase